METEVGMSASSLEPMIFSDLGEAGLLCEYEPGPLDLTRQRRIWAVATALKSEPGIRELVPGMNNLVVLYDPAAFTPDRLMDWIRSLKHAPIDKIDTGRLIEIPVIYGGETGPDLIELAERAGLDPVEFATQHSQAEYTVFAFGSQPGFGYLGGLPARLATPRRDMVHPRVEAGSVIIGGAQTAVQSRTTPSGWHVIGKTELVFFDPDSDPPTLLALGDQIRFKLLEVLS